MKTPLHHRQRKPDAPYYFIVAGASLTSLPKVLKPALPKKKQEASYLVVISALEGSIKIAIPGAAASVPAITSGEFVAELPYAQFKFILTDPFDPQAVFRCDFSEGLFCFNGMATHSPQILVRTGPNTAASDTPVPPPTPVRPVAHVVDPIIADPLDATVGSPMLAAYVAIRKYGMPRYIMNANLAAQQFEVDKLLKKADRLLRPLEITRADLEHLLDQKVGLA